MTITGDFERLQYFNFETSFLTKKTFFKKLEYRFVCERTTIANAIFPYKTVLSKANAKANRMGKYKMDLLKGMQFYH